MESTRKFAVVRVAGWQVRQGSNDEHEPAGVNKPPAMLTPNKVPRQPWLLSWQAASKQAT